MTDNNNNTTTGTRSKEDLLNFDLLPGKDQFKFCVSEILTKPGKLFEATSSFATWRERIKNTTNWDIVNRASFLLYLESNHDEGCHVFLDPGGKIIKLTSFCVFENLTEATTETTETEE
jgi:hypothetical protein